jgi:hypothetical protein
MSNPVKINIIQIIACQESVSLKTPTANNVSKSVCPQVTANGIYATDNPLLYSHKNPRFKITKLTHNPITISHEFNDHCVNVCAYIIVNAKHTPAATKYEIA